MECGAPVKRLFCSSKCRDRDRHRRFREQHGVSRSGVWARGLSGEKREAYLLRVREQTKRRGRNERKRESEQRRRAVKSGAYTDPVSIEAIGRRDRWRCHICAAEIDRSLRHPDPLSLSIDRVVPLSVGGTHEPANVKLAHLRCNVSRGARPLAAPVQMVIDFGRTAALVERKPKLVPVKPLHHLRCPVCGEESVAARPRTYCSPECGRVANAIRARERYEPKNGRHKAHRILGWAA